MCEQMHGPKPSPLHEVAHSCGQGHLPCVSPFHVRWATRSENQLDRRLHGTASYPDTSGEKNPCSILREDEVREIKQRLQKGEKQAILFREFNMSRNAISLIALGKTWRHVT